MKITSEIPGTIKYTIDGNEPDETSLDYTDVIAIPEESVIKAKIYPTNTLIFEPSDIVTKELPVLKSQDIPIGTTILDNSVVAYDRGSQYGDYALFDGNIFRLSPGTDDGTAGNENWRFIIIEKYSNDPTYDWGFYTPDRISTEIGRGLPITDEMLAENDNELWNVIRNKRNDGYLWFIPTLSEFLAMRPAKNYLNLASSYYWTSSVVMTTSAKKIYAILDDFETYIEASNGNVNRLLLARRV